jgi:hypothetical protein
LERKKLELRLLKDGISILRRVERVVSQAYQSCGGKVLYPTLEQKAAMLLCLIVNNHTFVTAISGP